ERVLGQDECGAHEHSHRGDRGAVDAAVWETGRFAPLLAEKMRQEERDGDGYGRRRGGLEANRDPGDDRRGRTRLRGLRDLLHGSPIPRRVVLSNEDEREARDDPDYTCEEEPIAGALLIEHHLRD